MACPAAKLYLNGLPKDREPESFESNTTIRTDLLIKDFTQNKSVGWTADKEKFGFNIDFTSDGLHFTTSKNATNGMYSILLLQTYPQKSMRSIVLPLPSSLTGLVK